MSYKNLEIWKLAREAVVDIHNMTLTELPKFELFEEGSQIRRSSKSVKLTIVEGYGRRDYKQEFIRYLSFAIASNDETMDNLETLWETESLKNENIFNELHEKIDKLGRKLNLFIKGVEEHHQSKNESSTKHRASNIEHRVSSIEYL
jgi:four helix bundle protein